MSAKRSIISCTGCGITAENYGFNTCNACAKRRRAAQTVEYTRLAGSDEITSRSIVDRSSQRQAGSNAARLMFAMGDRMALIESEEHDEPILHIRSNSGLLVPITGSVNRRRREQRILAGAMIDSNNDVLSLSGDRSNAESFMVSAYVLRQVIDTADAMADAAGIQRLSADKVDRQPPRVYALRDGVMLIEDSEIKLLTAKEVSGWNMVERSVLQLSSKEILDTVEAARNITEEEVAPMSWLVQSHEPLVEMAAWRLRGISKSIDAYANPVAGSGKSVLSEHLAKALPGLVSYYSQSRRKLGGSAAKWSEYKIPLATSLVAIYDESGCAPITRDTLDGMTSQILPIEVKGVQEYYTRRIGTPILVGHDLPYLPGGAQGMEDRMGSSCIQPPNSPKLPEEHYPPYSPSSVQWLRWYLLTKGKDEQYYQDSSQSRWLEMSYWPVMERFVYAALEWTDSDEDRVWYEQLEHSDPFKSFGLRPSSFVLLPEAMAKVFGKSIAVSETAIIKRKSGNGQQYPAGIKHVRLLPFGRS